MTQVYAGVAEAAQSANSGNSKNRRKSSTGAPSIRLSKMPLALLGGLFIGALSVIIVRYTRFRLTGTAIGGADADVLLMVDIVLALTLAILLRTVVRVRSRVHGFGKLLGIAAMAVLMHNLVFIAPGLFERGFSSAWVDQVMAATKPNTVLFAPEFEPRKNPVRTKVAPGFLTPPKS